MARIRIGTRRSASAEPPSPRATKRQKTPPRHTKAEPPTPSPRRSPRSSAGGQGSPPQGQPNLVKANGLLRIKPPGIGRRMQPPRDLPGPMNQFPNVNAPFSKGFPNRGVDCYRSAVLAALFHVPAFYRYMGIVHNNCSMKTLTCLLCRLQDLCYNHWAVEDHPTNVAEQGGVHRVAATLYSEFHKVMKLNLPENSPELRQEIELNRQSDAREFLDYLLREQIRSKQSPQDSISFEEMFELDTKESWTCSECEQTWSQVVPTMQAGFYVPLDIEGARDGRSLRWMMIASNLFSTRSARRCSTASCVMAERDFESPEREVKTTILRAPQVLIIGLARFKAADMTKLFTRIHPPEILDLNAYRESEEVTGDVRYRLDAVVAHQGYGIDGGHYIAAVRKHFQMGFEVVDDMNVGPTRDGGLSEVQKPCTSDDDAAETVILMYSKL